MVCVLNASACCGNPTVSSNHSPTCTQAQSAVSRIFAARIEVAAELGTGQ